MNTVRFAGYRKLRPWKRHSLVLAVLGSIYICIGLTYLFTDAPPSRDSALRIALQIMPLRAWGLVFMGVGSLAVASSRWPEASETWGYSALSGMSTLWACFYVWGVVLGASASQLTGALLWGGVAFLWWAISGLVNPPQAAPRIPVASREE